MRRAPICRLLIAFALATSLPVVAISDADAQQISKRRAWLGVELDTTSSLAPAGVRVERVMRNSPAERAGLRGGDVVQHVDGTQTSNADELVRLIAARSPGDSVRLSIVREGSSEPLLLSAKLGVLPDGDELLRLDKIGSSAPPWPELMPASGVVPRSLEELRGRVVILDFWASWCSACRMAAPRLAALHAKLGAQGLTILGIADDSIQAAARAAKSFGIRYPIASDEAGQMQRAYGIRAIPTMFIIDKRGIVRDVVVGFDPSREPRIEKLLESLLAEPAPPSQGE